MDWGIGALGHWGIGAFLLDFLLDVRVEVHVEEVVQRLVSIGLGLGLGLGSRSMLKKWCSASLTSGMIRGIT